MGWQYAARHVPAHRLHPAGGLDQRAGRNIAVSRLPTGPRRKAGRRLRRKCFAPQSIFRAGFISARMNLDGAPIKAAFDGAAICRPPCSCPSVAYRWRTGRRGFCAEKPLFPEIGDGGFFCRTLHKNTVEFLRKSGRMPQKHLAIAGERRYTMEGFTENAPSPDAAWPAHTARAHCRTPFPSVC